MSRIPSLGKCVVGALLLAFVLWLVFWRGCSALPIFTSPREPRGVSNSGLVGSASNSVTLTVMPASLAELQKQLVGLDKATLAAVIRRWLDSGKDAPTGQGFVLAPDGSLKEAPTLRVLLLNELIKINPAAAADYAKTILSAKTSADEWAVAMRAYALSDTSVEGREFLQQKFREMLGVEGWRQNPSGGFLEAFDVAVFIKSEELTRDLAQWVGQTNNVAVAHAAYLALDRLIDNGTAGVLEQLEVNPEWMTGREAARADYFARADVRDARQKLVLEQYLLDTNRSVAELRQFAGVFPNANYMVSYNLLTQPHTPTGGEITIRDRESLQVVEGWLNDWRFIPLKPQLLTIKQRLVQFVNRSP